VVPATAVDRHLDNPTIYRVRIAELSRRSGTSVPSIKFYLREGLLSPGEARGRNQADYAEGHLHRLRLIRALIDVGGLSVAAAREVIAAVDTPGLPGHALLGAAAYPITHQARRDIDNPLWQSARAEIITLVRELGWYVEEGSPGIDLAADAVAAMHGLGDSDLVAGLRSYARAASETATEEVDIVNQRQDPARMVEGVVVGTILGEALFNALRRLAREDASARKLLTPDQLEARARGERLA
jgi:DNA-binding transcriptional MerR regulator